MCWKPEVSISAEQSPWGVAGVPEGVCKRVEEIIEVEGSTQALLGGGGGG